MLRNCPGARRLSGSFVGNLLLIAAGFVFGELLLFLIMVTEDDPGTWFCMGTAIALVMLLVTTVLFYGVGYTGAFSLALSMNCTRRRFVLGYSGRILAHLVLGYLLVLGLYRLELVIGGAAFSDYPLEVEFGFLTDWRIVLAGMVGMLLSALFVGAMFGRFGRKAGLIVYFVWMFFCLVVPKIFTTEPGGEGIFDQAALVTQNALLQMPPAGWYTLGGIAAVGMTATVLVMARNQMVR